MHACAHAIRLQESHECRIGIVSHDHHSIGARFAVSTTLRVVNTTCLASVTGSSGQTGSVELDLINTLRGTLSHAWCLGRLFLQLLSLVSNKHLISLSLCEARYHTH